MPADYRARPHYDSVSDRDPAQHNCSRSDPAVIADSDLFSLMGKAGYEAAAQVIAGIGMGEDHAVGGNERPAADLDPLHQVEDAARADVAVAAYVEVAETFLDIDENDFVDPGVGADRRSEHLQEI